MAAYKNGQTFKDVPVLKFIGYDRIVVLFNGRPECALIEGGRSEFEGVEIYHISPPCPIVANIRVKCISDKLPTEKEREERMQEIKNKLDSVYLSRTETDALIHELRKLQGQIPYDPDRWLLIASDIHVA